MPEIDRSSKTYSAQNFDYRDILNTLEDGFILLNRDFILVDVNAEILRRHEKTRDQMIGRSHWEAWPAIVGTVVETNLRQVMENRVPRAFKFEYSFPAGMVWLETRAYPVSEGMAIFSQDVTRAETARVRLQMSEDRFRAAITATGVMWTNDEEGKMSGEQPSWATLTGQSKAEYEAYGWSTAIHPDDVELTVTGWHKAVAERRTFVGEHRVRCHDGVYRSFSVKAVPVTDDQGLVREWVGVHTDITERKQAEQELHEAARRKDEFLAMLAHELRNPLAPIGAAAQLLQKANLDAARVQKTSEVIRRQVGHMTALIDDLLDVSRVTRGLVELSNEVVPISQIVSEAVEQVMPLIRARRHQLSLHQTPNAALVSGDKKRLIQVITNILNNAAKYTPEGGEIRLTTNVAGKEVTIQISDNGIGMTASLVEHAFDLFAQAERTSDRSSGGLGLGLALVKSLVELHGGSVTCESDGLGTGSTFYVRLRRELESRSGGSKSLARNDLPTSALPLRIMIVDDNVDAAAMLSMLLEAAGHEVLVEHDSYRALENARQHVPQAFVLDIGLPQLDGYELARRLRAHSATADAVLIAVTGYGQEHDRANAITAGFDHHLVKPVDAEKLEIILAKVTSRQDTLKHLW